MRRSRVIGLVSIFIVGSAATPVLLNLGLGVSGLLGVLFVGNVAVASGFTMEAWKLRHSQSGQRVFLRVYAGWLWVIALFYLAQLLLT